ncbi:SDR family NAD(P)-dependent oxidoreductase [Plantactinospora sp. GCM10030261]|uniref:SDR family NAD(P)-dependent oxidoreductase n=1 Tax=Plantactinospora sp. GCM10030261 TaxID=3273420 RepID=UPI0036201079
MTGGSPLAASGPQADTDRRAASGPRADGRPLAGRHALVTGASRNLGATIAGVLAAAGADVAITYHESSAAAADLVGHLGAAHPGRHLAVRGDLTTTDGTRAAVTEAMTELDGRVDILVNNYGPFSMVPFTQLDHADWQAVWSGNVTAIQLACQLVLPGMNDRRWGRVINVSAGSAYLRNHSIYGLAKAAVLHLTEALALEAAPGVTVNAVAPGQIDESAADVAAIDPTFVERAVARTPAGRLVTRAEVAEVVALLCDPTFAMLTGAVLPLDGGWRFNRF